MDNITQSFKVIAIALVLSVGISYVSAWTAPTATPPNSNVSAPINVGSTAQTKTGDLTVNKITAPTSCIGADCRTAWPTGGDNLGNHTATQALTMGGNNINNAGTVTATGGVDVGNAGGAYTYITMRDNESPNGVKYIHANSNVVGFLSGAGGWLSYWADNGDSYQVGNANVNDVWVRASGKWASQLGGNLNYATTIEIGYIRGGDTDQTFNCPSGYVVTGFRGGGDGGGGGEVEFVFIRCTRFQ
jgi:hypothetical protein